MAARTVVVPCVVCRGPLHIPAHALPTGAQHVLCPSCHAAPSQPKLAGNPYPIPVLSSSIALIYPERAKRPLRVCTCFGCGAHIPPTMPSDVCEPCARAGFARPPPAAPPDMGVDELELVYPDVRLSSFPCVHVLTRSRYPPEKKPQTSSSSCIQRCAICAPTGECG